MRILVSLLAGCLTLAILRNPESPPKMTVPLLLEQATGGEVYWNEHGETPGWFDPSGYWNFSRQMKRYAIKELARMGPKAASSTIPTLIEHFEKHDDYHSGDGVVTYRSDIARCLGIFGDPKSIDPLLRVLRKRATDPTMDPTTWSGDLKWFDPDVYYDDGRGCGPVGIIHGLQMFQETEHDFIEQELRQLLLDLKSTTPSSQWAITAITEGLEFFNLSSAEKPDRQQWIKRRYDMD